LERTAAAMWSNAHSERTGYYAKEIFDIVPAGADVRDAVPDRLR
jgi:hypothetical protein